MKRVFLLLFLALVLPIHTYASSQSKQWEADFKKLEKEKNEKLAPLLKKITDNRIFNLLYTTENSIPQLRILMESHNECIYIRFKFIEQASKIGDNSFQSRKFNIMSAEKVALDTDSYNRDVYKIRLDDLEYPSLIASGFAMAQEAILLYETAYDHSDIHPERFSTDIQNAYAQIDEASKRLNRAKNIAKRKNQSYNSPEEWRRLENNCAIATYYKDGISSILEQISNLPAKLRERLDAVVESIDSQLQSPSHFESMQRTVSAILKELDGSTLLSSSEKHTLLEKMAAWERAMLRHNPLRDEEISEEEKIRIFDLNPSQDPVNDKELYLAKSKSIKEGKDVYPLDQPFAQDAYSLFSGQYYRFVLLGQPTDTILKVTVYDNESIVHEEALPLPSKGTLDWELVAAEDGLICHPNTMLQERFGLDLKFRFLPGNESSSKIVLSAKGMASDYRYAISLEDSSLLFEFHFVSPPPRQLNDLRKPIQSTQIMPLPLNASTTPAVPSEFLNQKVAAATPRVTAFAESFNRNPVAIAEFVQNEIALFDPFLHVKDGVLHPPLIYRSPEETLLSREGSPWEQCILLATLLRDAGYEAVCVEGEPHVLPGEFLERMLFMYVPMADYIQVKYPWVLLKDGGEWITLFPWIKEIQVTEGFDPYAFFPDEYASGDKFVGKYLCNDPEIMKHIGPDNNDTAGLLFVRFLYEQLTKNSFTLMDAGTQRQMQKMSFSSWADFPRPLKIGTWISAPDFSSRNDLFEECEVSIFSNQDPNNKRVVSGPIRFADLRGRALRIGFSSEENGKHRLHLAVQEEWEKQLMLDPSDIDLTVQVLLIKLPTAKNTYTQMRTFPIAKGSSAALCFQAGQSGPDALAILKDQIAIAETTSDKLHALLSFVGTSYFDHCHRSEMLLSSLHRMPSKTQLRLGLAKLAPDTSNGPIVGEPELLFPQVEMQSLHGTQNGGCRFQETSSGVAQLNALLAADRSSNEHQILRDIFDDPHAISAVKLLQIAHKTHQEREGSGPGFLHFTAKRFADADTLPELARICHFSHLPGISLRKIRDQGYSIWEQLRQLFKSEENIYLHDTYAYMTPGPIENNGMAALIVHPLNGFTLITDSSRHLNGGFGSPLNINTLEEKLNLSTR